MAIDIEAPGGDEGDLVAALRALVFSALPTSDPMTTDAPWKSGDAVVISRGPILPLTFDFVTHAYTKTGSSVAVTELLYADEAVAGGDFDAADIVATGYDLRGTRESGQVPHSGRVVSPSINAVIAAAISPVDLTVTLDFTTSGWIANKGRFYVDFFDTPAFSNYREFYVRADGSNGELTDDNVDVAVPQLAHGDHRVVFTHSAERMAISVDGGSVIGLDVDPVATSLGGINFSLNSINLTAMTIQAAVNEATLPTLSHGPDVPRSITQPTISGTPTAGETQTCDPGTWENSPTLTYQWRVYDLDTGIPSDIMGETAATYDAPASVIDCAVTGTNGAGAFTVYAAAIEVTA